MRVAVIGASGWVGRKLVPALINEGHEVVGIVRRPGSAPAESREAVVDLTDSAALTEVLGDSQAAYHLVHSMDAGPNYASLDREIALSVREACARAGLGQLIYLGGLGDDQPNLSQHLASRRETGELLMAGKTPVTILRAGMLIGQGSASFDMLRDLAHRLPAMITPRWVENRTQAIWGDDAVRYLVGVLGRPEAYNRSFDIGSPDALSYREMMQRAAVLMGRPRPLIVTVPVLTPSLSSRWAGFVTRVPVSVARPLIEGLRVETICRDDEIQDIVDFTPLGFDAAIQSALAESP